MEQHTSSRGQKTASAWEEVENTSNNVLRHHKTPLLGVRARSLAGGIFHVKVDSDPGCYQAEFTTVGAPCTGTGLGALVIRAGVGWRRRRELAPRCLASPESGAPDVHPETAHASSKLLLTRRPYAM